MGPDTRKIGPTRGSFNGRFKKSGELLCGLLANAARSGYTVRTTSTERRVMAKGQKRSNREAKKPKQAKSQKKGAASAAAAKSPKK
jgi:hypothetical protein